MCFGSKSEMNDDPAPKVVQNLDGRNDVKTSSYKPPNNNGGAGGPSGYHNYAPPAPLVTAQPPAYAPPAGAPPGQQSEYAPPEGPPPNNGQHHNGYSAPPGPPPSQQQGEYAPPPGPPPFASGNNDWAAPPPNVQHDWQAAVPDTSLFPPPPPFFSGYDSSPTHNATEEEADAGEDWCEEHPLVRPMVLDEASRTALHYNNFRLMEPTGFNGKLNWLGPGHWEGQTASNSPDRCIIGYPPLYAVNIHDPTATGQPKTIYYEVKIRPDSRTVNVGFGFTALPYPSFRMPGWHRGSLAVHGDDGRKYINDRWGGKDFTTEFRRGESYGIGMTFTPMGGHKPRVEVFFTRNGVRAGGWDLNEETDAEQDLPVVGLEGFHDLSCAIGSFDGASFEVIFEPSRWMYKELR